MPDILVIGAGPVGATFALLAQSRGLEVALIDAREGASRETRSLALSHGSRVILERAGAWQVALDPAEIHIIHTSQKGGFGRVKLSREDANVPALGYVVTYHKLQDQLDETLDSARVSTIFGARVAAIEQATATTEATVRFEQNGEAKSITAKIIVMADGGANLDKLDGVTIDEKDYGQSAMLGHVIAERTHGHIAYERFTPEGPLALLPSQQPNEYGMVWIADHDKMDALMALDDAACCTAFAAHFGSRAGRLVSLTARRRYPLRLRQTNTRVAGRVAIIGNAAQAMHPVAGQGFNLGLRDAVTLANLLAETTVDGALTRYDAMRETDVSRGVGFTDLLASTFLSDTATLRIPRGLALAAVDMLPGVRRALVSRMLFGVR